MENRSPLLTAHYKEKAQHFFQGMELLADDLIAYRTAVGLLAIHSAISLNDAIIVGTTGRRSKSEDHRAAAQDLKQVCHEMKVKDLEGVRHFTWLLSKKTLVAYGEDRINEDDLKSTISRSQRFENWAYRNFKEVLRVEETE